MNKTKEFDYIFDQIIIDNINILRDLNKDNKLSLNIIVWGSSNKSYFDVSEIKKIFRQANIKINEFNFDKNEHIDSIYNMVSILKGPFYFIEDDKPLKDSLKIFNKLTKNNKYKGNCINAESKNHPKGAAAELIVSDYYIDENLKNKTITILSDKERLSLYLENKLLQNGASLINMDLNYNDIEKVRQAIRLADCVILHLNDIKTVYKYKFTRDQLVINMNGGEINQGLSDATARYDYVNILRRFNTAILLDNYRRFIQREDKENYCDIKIRKIFEEKDSI